jgi:CheY-like chemotaxis protein
MSLTDTILIVDDSSLIVDGLVAILKKSYRPLAAYGGQQCLGMLSKEKPSIVILDIMMEPMDGWETLAHIKENPATRHIPVLMFSAKKISAEEAEEHRISIDDFISKPVTPKKLIKAIEKVLARQKANRVNIESWLSAGIMQDRIDEYISLMTSQEVDLSLLQNMKVQLSLIRLDDEESRTNLEAVIAAIEGRIQQERLLEEKLSREMQESVARDTEVKERALAIPVMNDSDQESLPVDRAAETAAQPQASDLLGSADGEANPVVTEVTVPEVRASDEVTAPVITTIPKVRLPDAGLTTKTTDPLSLFNDRVRKESPKKEAEMKRPGKSHDNEPGLDPVPPRSSFPKENLKNRPSIRPLHPETKAENSWTGRGNFSPYEEVPPLVEQKHPAGHKPRARSSRTLDNKPVLPDAPIPRTAGSGTDVSLRRIPYSVGRSYGNNRNADNGESVPDKDAPPVSGNQISGIISKIIGIFKRQEK